MSKLTQYVRHLAVVAIATLLAQCAWAEGGVVSINMCKAFTVQTDQETLAGTVPVANWIVCNENSGVHGSKTDATTGVSVDWDLVDRPAGTCDVRNMKVADTCEYFKSGLCRGNRASAQYTISIGNIAFANYKAYVYFTLDNYEGTSSPYPAVMVNDGNSYRVNNGALEIGTGNWGTGPNADPGMTAPVLNENAICLMNLSGSTLKLSGTCTRGAIAAIQIVETAASKTISCDDVFAATDAEALEVADIYNLTIPANGTFTVDTDLTRSYNLISEGTITLTGANLTTANLAKLVNQTQGYIYRIESDLSAGTTPGFGEGTYSYKNAKITNDPSQAYKFVVKDGDTLNLAASRVLASLDVQGGAVTIGDVNGSGSFWYGGKTATTYNQTGGTVTSTANGTGTSGSGNGLLLGWSQQMGSMTVSGGTLQVPNSSLNFWDGTTTLNISGGTVKAKGVFKGNSSGHQVVLSDAGTFELGSIGWTGVGLTLNGGTFKAYENTTMSSSITMGGAANIEVPADVELKLAGSVTGEGIITKKGAGVLNVGSARPTINVVEGSVKIVATTTEITAGKLVLPIPEGAAEGSLDKVSVVTAEDNAIEINGDPIIDAENHTITINLVTIPAITEATTISSLNLPDDKTGTLVIQGAATAESAYTVTFDTALPEGVDITVNGIVTLAGENIPYTKITIEDGTNLTVPSFTGTVASGITITTASATGTINNNGTLNVTGDSTYTLTNNGTLNVKSGVSTVSRGDDQSIKGTVNIDAGAEFVNKSGDAVSYGTPGTTVNVRGTLTMADNTRWTVGGSSVINLYGGCTVTGATTGDGAFDLFRNGEIITVNRGANEEISAVTIDAKLRARNGSTDNASEIKIASGMTLAVTGGFGYADRVGRVKRTGDGHFTGTIPLSDVTLIYSTGSVNNIPAHFVVSGTSTIEWHGNGSDPVCSNDSKTDPFITVNSGATLNIYGHDFSGWNGALRTTGWIVNNGTLVFENGSGSRFWREHIVMGNGSTVKIDNGGRALLMYGGAGTEDDCQLMLPEGSATIQSGTEGDKAVLYFGNDGEGGWGDNDAAKKATGISVGENATLTISCPIKGNQAITKHGAGTLVIASGDYSGAVTLKAGSIKSAISLNVTCDDANKKLETSEVDGDGYTTYSLVQRDPATIQAIDCNASGFTLNGAAVTMIEGDIVEFPSTLGNDGQWSGTGSTVVAGHEVIVNKPLNWKANIGTMTIGADATVYFYDGDINDGAEIKGDGKFQLQWSKTINGSVTISTSEIGYGTGGGDGSETYPKFTLASDSELTIAEQDSGRVISGVDGKVAKYADGKYTLVTAIYKVKVPTVDNAMVSAEGYTADANGYITVEHGASVIFTVTPNDGYNIGSATTITVENVTAAVESVDVSSIEITEAVPPAPTATVEAITVEGVEGAHSFTADEMTEKQAAYYGDWNADFIVTFSRDMAEGEVTLTGQSDHNGTEWVDIDIGAPKAGVGIPLIASVLEQTGWTGVQVTYAFVYETVGTFNCGVKNNLAVGAENATMTVQLVISNGAKSIPIGEAITHELIAPTGPTSWTDVTEETKVTDIVSAETAAALKDSKVKATDIATWATTLAGKGVMVDLGAEIPVNALIFNCAPSAAPTTEAGEAAAADEVIKTIAKEYVLLDLMEAAAIGGGNAMTIKEYPMATIELKEVTTDVAGEGATNTHLFKLVIELK